MSKTIVVMGITGNQGSSVARTFLDTPGWHVRGVSRHPSNPTAQAWLDRGATLVAADLDDPFSLTAAFRQANVVFGTTDFWQHFRDPANHERARREGKTPNEVAFDREVEQGKMLVDAVAKADEESGGEILERFVLSTCSGTKKWSKGKINFNLHFDSKWAAVEYLRERYPELAKKTSFLQLGSFATNWKTGMPVPQKQDDGTYRVRLPINGDADFPMVDPTTDTGPLTQALLQVAPGTNLIGAGWVSTWNDWCRVWGEINEVTCTFEKIDRKVIEGALGLLGTELADMFQYIEEFGYHGGDQSAVYPWDLGVNVNVTDMEEYMRKQDWSQVL